MIFLPFSVILYGMQENDENQSRENIVLKYISLRLGFLGYIAKNHTKKPKATVSVVIIPLNGTQFLVSKLYSSHYNHLFQCETDLELDFYSAKF